MTVLEFSTLKFPTFCQHGSVNDHTNILHYLVSVMVLTTKAINNYIIILLVLCQYLINKGRIRFDCQRRKTQEIYLFGFSENKKERKELEPISLLCV